MTLFDVAILLFLAMGAVYGYRCGIVSQISSLTGMIVGVLACFFLGDNAVMVLRQVVPGWVQWPIAEMSSQNVATGILFLLVFLTCRVMGLFIKGVFRHSRVGAFDRVTGAALGFMAMLLFVSIALNVAFVVNPQGRLFSTARIQGDPMLTVTFSAAPWLLGGRPVEASSELLEQSSSPKSKLKAEQTSAIVKEKTNSIT